MPERTLGIGVLGCGPISQFAHLESVQKSRNTVLAAVCDADNGLARRFGSFYDAKSIYPDYDQMLADPGVEAVAAGRGIVDFHNFLKGILSTGYRGPLVSHNFPEEDAALVSGYLRRVLDEVMS